MTTTGQPGSPADDVQTELERAVEAAAEHARLAARLERATTEEAEAREVVAAARATLVDETADVQRLESFSPTRIWAALRGNRSTELEREQAEQQAAEYAVAVAEQRQQRAAAEVAHLEASMAALGDVEARRSAALDAVEERIGRSGSPVAAQLATLASEYGEARAALTEVREAQRAAVAAGEWLAQAGAMLAKARGWSTYDTFFGGGLGAAIVKYQRMDEASKLLASADQALRRLATELADTGISGIGPIQVGQTTRTLDVWFDNIVSDWSVHSKVEQALTRTTQAAEAVRQIRTRLQGQGAELEERLGRVRERRDGLLLDGVPK